MKVLVRGLRPGIDAATLCTALKPCADVRAKDLVREQTTPRKTDKRKTNDQPMVGLDRMPGGIACGRLARGSAVRACRKRE